MPATVDQVVRNAIARLETERDRIVRQITALRSAFMLDGVRGARGARRSPTRRRRRGRRRLSAAARNAASQRMKAYWANRRREKGAAKKAR